MKLLSIDPGVSTGWAEWDGSKLLKFNEERPETAFYDLLIEGDFNDVDQVVFEDYKIRPADLQKGWGHEWNNGPALQIIGAVKYWCQTYSIPYKNQQASLLPVGCGYIGYPYNKKKHTPNYISAVAHGAYYLVKNKVCVPGDLRGSLA